MEGIFQKHWTVGPESIDVLGHVNNREYLRWIEAGAIEHAATLGWTAQAYLTRKQCWVVREHWIEYLRPAFLGDELTLYTWVSRAEGARSLRRYAIVKDRKIICNAATEWAFVDLTTGRTTPMPPDVYETFKLVDDQSPQLRELGLSRRLRFLPYYEKNLETDVR